MKKIWIASFIFAAATAFAQDTCTELCSSCLDNNESGPCAKVEKICKCTEMIANFKAELQGDANNKTATGSVYESNAQTATAENRQAQDQSYENAVFWMGFSIAYESFMEQMEDGNLEADEFYHHLGANTGLVMRWQFYHWVSFVTGFNAIYHHGQYDLDVGSINYHNIIVEIPLQFRFALPLEKTKIRPFISISTHIRKPIYTWGDASLWSNMDKNTDNSSSEAHPFIDWEFMEYLGLGVELNRHVAIQWQPLLYSIRTSDPNTFAPYDGGIDTWRLNFEFTW